MNIISYNVRGLGRGVKWAMIRRMVRKEKVDMLCIQETKKENIVVSMCQALWGDKEVGWEWKATVNSTGGLLCLWSEEVFKLQNKVISSGFILLVGQWLKEAQTVYIVNIYLPCDAQSKRNLWENIKQLRSSYHGGLWCVLGDFNNVRNNSERLSSCHRGEGDNSIREFNEWIEDMELDAPWMGRKFTWYRPNGTTKSKLDRFLVSPDWINKWPATMQCTLVRNFSDHCLIILRSKVIDWGPKPFRVLDSWTRQILH